MSRAAEELFLKHDQDRRRAHDEAKRMADKIVLALHGVRNPNGFASMDLHDLLLQAQKLVECQERYIEADRAHRQCASEAFS